MKYFTFIYENMSSEHCKLVIKGVDSLDANAQFGSQVVLDEIYLIAEFETADKPKFNFFD